MSEPVRPPPTHATEHEAKVLASAVRMRILRLCLHEPRTNRQLADALQMNPATALHHVRRLVDAGFLSAQDAREGARGSREIPYQATRKSWRLSSPGVSSLLIDLFVQEAARVPVEQINSSRLGVKLKPADLEAAAERLHAVLREISALPSDPDGEEWSIFFAMHPDPDNALVPKSGGPG